VYEFLKHNLTLNPDRIPNSVRVKLKNIHMKIGIIGASLAGLIAGDKLAKAGHDVTLIINESSVGGHLATCYRNGGFFDYGVPFLTPNSNESSPFFNHLAKQKLIHRWADEVTRYDGSRPNKNNSDIHEGDYFACRKGFSAIAEHLKRWVDIEVAETAGGLTHIGANRGKKRSWMINLNDFSVFECDAVILAGPAVKAYGILQTAQDETAALRLIRILDEIQYEPRIVLMAAYERDMPEWKAIECRNSHLSWICNDSSKTDNSFYANITLHSSANFAIEQSHTEEEKIKELMLEEAEAITKESWIRQPSWHHCYHWKYDEAINPVDNYFMELEMEDAPLALTGDYFKGTSVEAEYLSAIKLADHWIDKYKNTVAINT
jgi:predicted NAD/FAD-dependent oxidoreductase